LPLDPFVVTEKKVPHWAHGAVDDDLSATALIGSVAGSGDDGAFSP
jgi:hypothetical protein